MKSSKQVQTKKDLDWPNIGFQYRKTDFRFSAQWKAGTWSEGELVESEQLQIHEGSPALHYAQECFEGLKAQTGKDGSILLFRPEENAKRMQVTARRLLIPEVPTELFLRAVEETVRANAAWIPPYGSGASLYIRPFLIGVGENLGLRPAPEFEFRVFVAPVGPYYKAGGLTPIALAVLDHDRAAPKGTGAYKAGANYAGGLLVSKKAQEAGANEALYLDAAQHRYLEEAGSANIILTFPDKLLVTPRSDAILPSITRRSILEIAEKELGYRTEHRPVDAREELPEALEMGACGTAAVLSPVSRVLIDDQWLTIGSPGEEVGPEMQLFYDSLVQLQRGEREDQFGWVKKVEL